MDVKLTSFALVVLSCYSISGYDLQCCKYIVHSLSFIFFFPQMIYSDEDRKFNIDITVGLIRSELLNLAEYNVQMAKLLDAGRNSMCI